MLTPSAKVSEDVIHCINEACSALAGEAPPQILFQKPSNCAPSRIP